MRGKIMMAVRAVITIVSDGLTAAPNVGAALDRPKTCCNRLTDAVICCPGGSQNHQFGGGEKPMGVGYVLVNHSRCEVITFAHLPVSKARELAGNPVTAALTTWYLLHHSDDRVAFVSDTYADWPFPSGSRADLANYTDVTDRVVAELVADGILRDEGIAWADEAEPQTVYMRALQNVWMQ
jgi:hypothetical protein